MPNQIGSKPSDWIVGNMIGMVMTIIEKASRNIPRGTKTRSSIATMKYGGRPEPTTASANWLGTWISVRK